MQSPPPPPPLVGGGVGGGGFVLVGGGVGGLVGPVGSVTQENSWQIFPRVPQLSPTKEQAGSFPAAQASA